MSSEKNEKEGMPNTDPSSDINHEIFQKIMPDLDIPDFFKLIVKNSNSVGIQIMDKAGKILAVSKGIQSSLGYSHEDLIGKYLDILAVPEDRLKNLPDMELAGALQQGYFTDRNYLLHKDGSYIWVQGETVFTKNSKGEIFLVKLLFDVNEQKLLETHLADSNKKLNETMEKLNRVNKDLETFVYTASHDLKAPLGNIEALVGELEDELGKENRQEILTMLQKIRESLSKFRMTLNDLSNTGKAREEERKTEVSFTELMEGVKEDLKDLILKYQAIITEDFSRADRVIFSRKNLRSILFNLISNGIKYHDPERRPHVTVSTEKAGEYILLKVSDNGLGIKEEDKETIFSMYTRLHDHVEGSGIGLSILTRMVENNGGKIEIDSEVGKGSSFKVFLRENS